MSELTVGIEATDAGAPGGERHGVFRYLQQLLLAFRETGEPACLRLWFNSFLSVRRNGIQSFLSEVGGSHTEVVVSRFPARLRRDGAESAVVLEDLSLGGALLTVHDRIDPGADVILALRQAAARPAAMAIPSRVLRVADGPVPGQAPWRAAVAFPAEARLRVAGVLAGLGPRTPGEAP